MLGTAFLSQTDYLPSATSKMNTQLLPISSNLYSKNFQAGVGLKIEPEIITFDDVVPGQLYALQFALRNVTSTAQRIRIKPPKNTFFALNYVPTHATAPGLEVRAELECRIPENSSEVLFSETITASLGEEVVDVRIVATKKCARVEFENFMDLGRSADPDRELTKDVIFINRGSAAGHVEIKVPDDSRYRVRPMRFELAPFGMKLESGKSHRLSVKVTYDGKDVCIRKEAIPVVVKGGLQSFNYLELSAEIVKPKLTLLGDHNTGVLENQDFGKLFCGETRTVRAFLVNSGQVPVSYSVLYSDEEDRGGAASAPQTDDDNNQYKCFTVSPIEGVVKALSQVPITITFSPTVQIPKQGFEKQYLDDVRDPRALMRRIFIECPELDQRTNLTVQGQAVTPVVTLAPAVVRFGHCPVLDRRDIVVTLQNRCNEVTSFAFPPTAHFKMNPAKGQLQPLQTMTVVVSFIPGQMGKFKSIIKLAIADGKAVVEMKVVGEADIAEGTKTLVGGIDKLGGDFEAKLKFVDPHKMLVEKLEAEKAKGALPRAGDKDTVSLTSSDRDHVYSMNSTSDQRSVTPTTASQNLTYGNRQVYNEYLVRAREHRETHKATKTLMRTIARGAPNRIDPAGTDLGMERGLSEPTLRAPVADEPLWLAKAEPAVNAMLKLPTDENKLIGKKWPDQPISPADMKHCIAELDPGELSRVTATHKMINFGQVSVTSTTIKSLAILNELNHCIRVTIDGLSSDLKLTKPLGQVIPGGEIAGFDVTFVAKQLGKARRTFSWLINGIHQFTVTVAAEVVPIDLMLKKDLVSLCFPPESTDPTVSETFTIANPGNANAEYFLTPPANTPFAFRPEKGQIGPGKTAQVAVIWTPKQGRKNDADVTLDVKYGIQQTFKVEGQFLEPKVAFVDKALNVGTIPLGNDAFFETKLRNTGAHPAVFYVNAGEGLGEMTVTPEQGLIGPGESCPLKVKIHPRKVQSFGEATISVGVRGGKVMALKLEGNSIIPQVKLEQSSFAYGSVIVGSCVRLPFTLTNESSIPVELVLNLSDYPDFSPLITAPTANGTCDMIFDVPVSQDDDYGNVIEFTTPTPRDSEGSKGGPVGPPASGASVSALSASNRRGNNHNAKPPKKLKIYSIYIPLGATLSGALLYKPSKAQSFDFRLPLTLKGMPSSEPCPVTVNALGMASAIVMSSQLVDFENRIVARDASARATYCKEITLRNTDNKKTLAYEIRDALGSDGVPTSLQVSSQGSVVTGKSKRESIVLEIPPPIFFVSPTKGEIMPGQTITVYTTFLPAESGSFSKQMDIFLTDQEEPARPYLSFFCRGVGMHPRLTFSRQYVDLPTVPLGITSQATFWVINQGYTNLELKHRVSPTVPIELDVQFPDGADVGMATDRVRVVVSGKSDQPTSWAGKIEFTDTDNERFSIAVSGCADNSLMTNFPFVRQFQGKFGYLALEDQPIKYLSNAEITQRVAQDSARRENEESKSPSMSPDKPPTKSLLKSQKSLKSQKPTTGRKTSVSLGLPEAPAMGQSDPQYAPQYELQEYDWKAAASGYVEIEAIVVLKWLNRFVVSRSFDAARFPLCIIETHGDIVVEFIEQISGRKIGGIKPGAGDEAPPRPGKDKKDPSAAAANTARKPSRGQAAVAKMAQAQRLVEKYRVMLNYLIQGGALLNHINAADLLGLEHHLMAQETDLKKSEGARLTSAMLAEAKVQWTSSWAAACKFAWMEVLLQALKIYTISRASYKDFLRLPGVVAVGAEGVEGRKGGAGGGGGSGGAATARGKKSPKDAGPVSTPSEFTQSNLYSPQEVTLLTWASHHILHAMHLKMQAKMENGGEKKRKDDVDGDDDNDGDVEEEERLSKLKLRIFDLETTFADIGGYCQLLHSHKPELTRVGGPLVGYATNDESKTYTNYKKMKGAMDLMYLSFDVQVEEIAVSARTMLLMLAHMYLTLPGLLPKAAVEFQGVIGIPLTKTIELSNHSRRKVGYNVVIEGSDEYSFAAREIVLEPESKLDFPVTLLAVFSSPPATAKLTFLGLRNAAMGVAAGATMVFQLTSVIIGRKPIERVFRPVPVYDLDPVTLNLVNPFDEEGNFTMKLVCQHKSVALDVVVDRAVRGLPARPSTATTLGYSSIPQPPKLPAKQTVLSRPATRADKVPDKTAEEVEIEAISKQPYWTTAGDDTITLPPRGVRTVLVNFLPFVVGTHSCQVVLTDPHRGEFSYEIVSEVSLPKSEINLEFAAVIEDGAPIKKCLKVGAKNPIFERAVTMATDMRIQSSALVKKQARDTLMNLLCTPVTNEEDGTSTYMAVIQSPFFSCQRDLPLASEYGFHPTPAALVLPPVPPAGAAATALVNKEPKGPQVEKKRRNPKSAITTPAPAELSQWGNSPSNIMLTFNAGKAGAYQGRVIVYSKESNYDVRVVDLMAKTTIPNCFMLITFNGAARQRLTQEIPIKNESDHDWNLTATIAGAEFSGDKVLKIPAGEVGKYCLTFCGADVGSFEGTLHLKNSSSEEGDDSFEFTLKGAADEPLAEDHCVFRCPARSKESFSVPLLFLDRKKGPGSRKGPSGPQKFAVQTDIPCVIGASEVEVRGGGQKYDFQFFSTKGGMFSGSIIFTEVETGAIVWYTIDVIVESPQAESSIHVEAEVRKAVAVEITLDNPTNEELVFAVEIDGPGLLGETTFRLPPSVGSADYDSLTPIEQAASKRNVYELVFSPLVAGSSSGRISFTSSRMGEIWYNLTLEATLAMPTVLDQIECMIGMTGAVSVPLDNPLSEEITLQWYVSDPEHFTVLPETLTLGAYEQGSFEVHFRPSSLTDTEESTVTLSHPSFGELVYIASGVSGLPGVLPTVQLFAPLGEMGSHTIMFRNPFPFPLPADIFMTSAAPDASTEDESKGAFGLLLRKPHGIVIPPKGGQQIGVSFAPVRLGEYSAAVQVRSQVAGRNLLWCFPLSGMAESVSAQRVARLVTPCKSSILKDVEIALKGLRRVDLGVNDEGPELADFTFTLVIDPKYQSLLARGLRVLPKELVEMHEQLESDSWAGGDGSDFVLKYRALFEPLRVFSTTVEMIVSCKDRGRWKVLIDLDATEPEPDDTIRLTAAVGRRDQVMIRLSNRFLGYSQYQAYFTAKSSPHFTVNPTSGVLAPFGVDGTPFVITYAPLVYASREIATLIVMTDEVQWTYEVIGQYPELAIDMETVKSKVISVRR